MTSGRRITVALVALVLLAVVGWLTTDLTHRDAHGSYPARPDRVTGAPLSPSAPRPAGASG
ncbi:MAG TPA: hypothetical protein VHV74_00975 [Pseudonocardiaceae bacterium]|nr:hypothetical protein [Pseudonocardiaceae bacterium]